MGESIMTEDINIDIEGAPSDIAAHLVDSRGVYLHTEFLSPMGPQPAGAIYDELPEPKAGFVRVRLDGMWRQVLEADVPPPVAPVTPAVQVSQEVSMAQCRLALYDLHGIPIENDEDFYALTDILPEADRPRARFELRTRGTVRYDNPLVIAFCAAMGWDRDQLFIYGAAQ